MLKILVATDFTEYADYAVRAAASIARQTEVHLFLLHVVNRPLNSDDDSYENYHNMPGGDTVVSNIKKKMDAVVIRHNLKNVETIHELRYDVFKTILKKADSHQVDLIIMGAYGRSGSEESLIGSNTERVMQQAKMPVLIIKEKLKEFKIENLVLASEFYGDVYKVFPSMKKILDLFDSTIHLLKVNTPIRFQRTQDSIKLMTEFGFEFGLENNTTNVYNDLSVEEGIINFTKSINADLIAITPDGKWSLAHVFNKNITDNLMKNSIKGILSMKSQQPVPSPIEIFYQEDYKHFNNKD